MEPSRNRAKNLTDLELILNLPRELQCQALTKISDPALLLDYYNFDITGHLRDLITSCITQVTIDVSHPRILEIIPFCLLLESLVSIYIEASGLVNKVSNRETIIAYLLELAKLKRLRVFHYRISLEDFYLPTETFLANYCSGLGICFGTNGLTKIQKLNRTLDDVDFYFLEDLTLNRGSIVVFSSYQQIWIINHLKVVNGVTVAGSNDKSVQNALGSKIKQVTILNFELPSRNLAVMENLPTTLQRYFNEAPIRVLTGQVPRTSHRRLVKILLALDLPKSSSVDEIDLVIPFDLLAKMINKFPKIETWVTEFTVKSEFDDIVKQIERVLQEHPKINLYIQIDPALLDEDDQEIRETFISSIWDEIPENYQRRINAFGWGD